MSKTPKMKDILVRFKTKKGEEAYRKVREHGQAQPKMDKAIAGRVCKETIIQENPMILKIKIKIPRLAFAIDLPGQVVAGLEKFGAKKDRDYTMEVRQ